MANDRLFLRELLLQKTPLINYKTHGYKDQLLIRLLVTRNRQSGTIQVNKKSRLYDRQLQLSDSNFAQESSQVFNKLVENVYIIGKMSK